jgi:uncharacterized protein YndB with AHSA1/START domain
MSANLQPMSAGSTPKGSVSVREGRYVLRFERHLPHPIERVWAALTDPDELIGWLARAEVDLVEGGRIELHWLNTDEQGNSAVARGTLTRVEPPRLLEYDTDIHGLLRWELRENGDGCVLTFTNVTPAPEDNLPLVLAGWHIHLDHLADALRGHLVDWPRWNDDQMGRWTEYRDAYAAGLA